MKTPLATLQVSWMKLTEKSSLGIHKKIYLNRRLKKVQGKKKENKEKAELERKKQAYVSETGPIVSNNILKDYEDDEDIIFK